ncbi:MAG: hypothetical protein QGG40_04385 [Myxococcota bacterium]|jgi:ligand-binding SRPBCC domain-containing protein|nr:hypothetical protein [Myxococcota bacterium]
MPTTFRLRVWTRFLAPVDEVWKLKTDPAALACESAPYLRLRVKQPDQFDQMMSGENREPVEAKLCLLGLPVGLPYKGQLIEYSSGEYFRDEGRTPLYTQFEHGHFFEETPDGTRYIDEVVFTPALPMAKLSAVLTEKLFVHRHKVAAERLPTDIKATGVSVLRVADTSL